MEHPLLPSHSVHGPDAAWPIVFVHGFPFTRHQWDAQVAALQAQYRIITYDMRGHGPAPTGDGPLMIEFLVDDLVALLDHLELEQATICGLSMGGYVALRMIDRHPDRVHGLVLCDTRAEADSNEARIKRAEGIRAIRADGMAALANNLLPVLFGKQAVSSNEPGVQFIRKQIEETRPEGACQALAAMACRLDLSERLASIETPTLIVVGAEDALTPPEDSRRMRDAIPGARLVEIPGAGHVSNVARPDEFNEALLQFLRELNEEDSPGRVAEGARA